jgi:hypothetical protein
MSVSKDFLATQNISLLWDILSDGDIIKNGTKQYVDNVFNVFKMNLRGFCDIESTKNNQLVDMNKKYILLILNYINTSQHEATKTVIAQKPSEAPSLVTVEDIQHNRQRQFDQDLNKRISDFASAMSVAVPPVPDFSIKLDDEPIKEIAEKIRQITLSRNYDIEQITKTHGNSQQNWLKPEETSIKAEKLSINNLTTNTNANANSHTNNGNGLKYIKIDNYEIDGDVYKNQIIDLNKQETKKHISWEDENIKINRNEEIEKEIENSIFAKLKKIKTTQIETNHIETNHIETNQTETTQESQINLQEQIQHIHTRIDTLNDNIVKIMELLTHKIETI